MIRLDENNGRTSVGLWTDNQNSSYLFQSVKSKQPAYESGTIKFDGSQHELFGYIDAFDTGACAVYVITSSPVESGTVILATFFDVNDTANSDNYLQFGFVDNKPTVWYGDGEGRQMLQGSAVDTTTISTYRFISDGNERVLKKDGEQIASSTTDFICTVNALAIGSNGNGEYGKCSFRSVNYFDISKDDSEDETLTSEYNNKYQVNLEGPSIDSSNLLFLGIGENQMDVSWNEAYDDNTPQDQLTYYVYRSSSDNISTVTDAENNGTLLTSGDELTQYTASGLSSGTVYYFQVIVEDGDGEKTAYNSSSQITDSPGGASEFASVSGIYFEVNGRNTKLTGSNEYWLPTYMKQDPTYVDEFFNMMDVTPFKILRTWGFYDGQPQFEGDITLQPEPGVYNEEDLQKLDTIIQKAKNKGMMVSLSLCNYWPQLGGVEQYNQWAGESNPSENRMSKFINGSHQQETFKNYISMLLNRTNVVTGTAYKNEPAIFCWEIINEARNPGYDPTVLRDWYQDIAQHIKSIDPNHMVTTGEEGFENVDHNDNYSLNDYANPYATGNDLGTSYELNTAIPEIDFGQHHWYPDVFGYSSLNNEVQTATEAWFNDHQAIAESNNKPVYCGEYNWEDNTEAPTALQNWWPVIQSSKTACDIIWAIIPDGYKTGEYAGDIVYPNDTEMFNNWNEHVNSMQQALSDTVDPDISSFSLSHDNVTTQSFRVLFEKATDNITNSLNYKLYTSSSGNIGTVSDAENNGTLSAEGDGVDNLTASGFSLGETVYYNIIVSDTAGNKSAYSQSQVTTSSNAPSIDMNHSMAVDLVAYHQFYEGGGTIVNDISSNSHDINIDMGSVNANWEIYNNSPVIHLAADTANHMAFADHSDFNPSGSFSIGVFLSYIEYDNNRHSIIDGAGNIDGFSMRQSGWEDSINGFIGSVEYNHAVTSFKNDNVIHQLVITVNQSNETYSLYRDGTPIVQDEPYSESQSGSLNNLNSNWFLGSYGTDSPPATDTYWNRFAWWNRELTAEEVSDWNDNKDLMLN